MIVGRPAVALVALAVACSMQAAPAWVVDAARKPLATYPAGTRAVVLFDATEVSVDSGMVVTHRRRVTRILTSAGRDQAELVLGRSSDTEFREIRAWSITNGVEKTVSEGDAIETSPYGELFNDLKVKILRIPGAVPGGLVAFEYEERERPQLLETSWYFQGSVPVAEARLALAVPAGKFSAHWFAHEAVAPISGPDGFVWTLRDVPAIDDEPRRPSESAIAGRVSIGLYCAAHRTWSDVAQWYARLADPSCASSPQLTAKVAALVSKETPALERIRILSRYVQQQVRYVAVEIGIGGYQPHRAADIFTNQYGDCKDKVTLLRSMLRVAGIESFYVLVNTTPGVVDPDFATVSVFNHVIIAIRLPDATAVDGLHATVQRPALGTLLYFDPTSDVTSFGTLPLYLQQSHGVLVTSDSGELVTLPAATPATNQLRRHAVLQLDESGTVRGEIEEVRTGSVAAELRSSLRPLRTGDRIRAIESAVASRHAGMTVSDVRIENLDEPAADLRIHFLAVIPNYVMRTAGLVLLPRILFGRDEETMVDTAHRRYAYVTNGPSLQTDEIEISLPHTLQLDELPPVASVSNDLVSSSASAEVVDGKLMFRRRYEMRVFSVAPARLPELRAALASIESADRASVVFGDRP